MAVRTVRAGALGEREDAALNGGSTAIGWEELPDLSSIKTRDELRALHEKVYSEPNARIVGNHVGQIWGFLCGIETGDLVVLPLKRQAAVAIGRVEGPYKYRTDLADNLRHTRPIEWLRTDLPRVSLEQDLLYSLGSLLTVCRIERNNAEVRIRAIVEGKALPPKPSDTDEPVEPQPGGPSPNLERHALDLIRDAKGTKFRGHGLARFVGAILEAQGYLIEVSPPGPDGGVDVLAGKGRMGFDAPSLCIQVKSGGEPVDVKVLREFQTVVKNFGARQGLLISWSDFRHTVYTEAKPKFFEVRLWDADDLAAALLSEYDRLPQDLKNDLPLKRIWALVPEDRQEGS